MIRSLAAAAAFFCASQAAADECGPRIERELAMSLGSELKGSIAGLAAYADSVAGEPHAASLGSLLRQLLVLHERLGRVELLAEIRDTMRHGGEKSLVHFRLSHEAGLIRLISSQARSQVADSLQERRGIEQGVARLSAVLARANAAFATCDSPM